MIEKDVNDFIETPNGTKVDKIERYGWTYQDEPGELKYINKNHLEIDESYQRTHNREKARSMASAWSWVACGTIIVGYRCGVYFVIDGQHRVIASRFRSDIIELPCIVFKTEDREEEASGFLNANTLRKPVRIIDKYKALLVAKDDLALYIKDILDRENIVVTDGAHNSRNLAAIGSCFQMAKESKPHFEKTMHLISELYSNATIKQNVMLGIFYLSKNLDTPIEDTRLRKRILKLGHQALLRSTMRASAYYASGGYKVWALGMLEDINKGLREMHQFRFKG